MHESDWEVFPLDELLAKVERQGVNFKEFLRTPSLSCAIYHIPVGSRDMASAHEEDELYLVLEGRGQLRIGETEHRVQQGTLMYVRAACDHTFFDIQEDLTVLAFFGAPVLEPMRGRRLRHGQRPATDADV